jgi:hypothetical protein
MSMHMNVPRPRLLSALAIVLTAGALAGAVSGCGSSSATLDPVAQAADVTSAAGGVHMRFSMSVSIPNVSSPLTATGKGFFNYRSHEGKFALDMGGLPSSATTALGGSSFHVEELFKGTTIYVGSPLLASHLPGGARWMKVDAAKLGGLVGIDAQNLTSGASNPAQFLEYLRAHGGNATVVGSETLGGVPTTRYRGSIDLRQIAQSLPQSERATAQKALELLSSQVGLSSIPFEVWIDKQHRVRRMEMNFSLDAAGQTGGVQITVDFFGYGRTPSVTAPADSEVFTAGPSALGLSG